jgi:SOS-response transcriptional repressor LexA
MGGLTGKRKNTILRAMYEAELSGQTIHVKDLASRADVSMSTVSEHLHDLRDRWRYVYEFSSIRGLWKLTTTGHEYAAVLQPIEPGIPFLGDIAAGPALPIEQIRETLDWPTFDPATHFALRVRGTSMVSYGILDGDIAIFRSVNNWLDVPLGKVVAARVPEGTGVDTDDWLDQLEQRAASLDWTSIPPLDHVTLKVFDGRFRSYLHQGTAGQYATPLLRGSQGSFHPCAVAIAGVLVHLLREC